MAKCPWLDLQVAASLTFSRSSLIAKLASSVREQPWPLLASLTLGLSSNEQDACYGRLVMRTREANTLWAVRLSAGSDLTLGQTRGSDLTLILEVKSSWWTFGLPYDALPLTRPSRTLRAASRAPPRVGILDSRFAAGVMASMAEGRHRLWVGSTTCTTKSKHRPMTRR